MIYLYCIVLMVLHRPGVGCVLVIPGDAWLYFWYTRYNRWSVGICGICGIQWSKPLVSDFVRI
jgi:hypothetical protein